jgi:hypothetical protein
VAAGGAVATNSIGFMGIPIFFTLNGLIILVHCLRPKERFQQGKRTPEALGAL